MKSTSYVKALGKAAFVAALILTIPGVAGAATVLADRPDLVPALPSVPYANQVAPVYVDTFEQSGHVLYRFDSMIANNGGTLDLYRAPNGDAMQAIWPGGVPTGLVSGGYVNPNTAPSDPNATYVDLTVQSGASFVYSAATGHNHWHFQSAAKYELLLPGGGSRLAAKVGFCMADANPKYFPYGQTAGGSQTFCAPGNPSATFVRMGISPGTYDLYNSQVADQWVDVTGLAPGTYTLQATINPQNYIVESNTANNTMSVLRVIPGTVANPTSASTPTGQQVGVPVSGSIVGPDVPARKSGSCAPTSGAYTCYVTDPQPYTLAFAVGTQPAHGTVSFGSVSGQNATATYTPSGGYSGPDSFTYTVTDARGLKSIPATVSITVGSGGTSAPVNSVLPVVSGSLVQGQVLSASSGTWSGSPSFGYAWQRCASGGGSCVPISGAGSSLYTLVAADVGSSLRVVVTATNAGGSVAATSAATGVVSAPVPPPSGSGFGGSPVLDGFNRANGALGSGWSGLFSGEGQFTISSQKAVMSSGYGAAAWSGSLFGPDVEVYASLASPLGMNLFARMSGVGTTSLKGYSVEFHPNLSAIYVYRITNNAYSSPLGGAIALSFAGSGRVGMRVVGNTIEAWLDQGSGWVLVGSRTDSTYTAAGSIGAELYGGTNRSFDDFGGGTAGSAPPAPSAPVNSVLPVVSGSLVQGQVLSASSGTWSGSPSFGYAWQRCASGGGSCVPISGAGSSLYTLVAADVGSSLRVVVTATNAGGSVAATSAATGVVSAPAPSAPVNSVLPVVSGSLVQGQVLSASSGTWSGSPSFGYAWQRCASGGGSCVPISGAGSSLYTLVAADVGSSLRVVVTATNAGGSVAATSAATGVVSAPAPSAPVNSVLPVVSGSLVQGQVLSASSGTWSGSPSFGYAWQRCASGGGSCVPISGAGSSMYTLVAADVGSSLRVVVTATNAGGSVAATSAATGVVSAPVPPPSGSGFGGSPVLDGFNRANGALGSGWSGLFSGEGQFTISSQKAVMSSGYGAAAWSGSLFGPDVEVYASLASPLGMNLFARMSGVGTTSLKGYSVEFHPNLSAIYVYRITNNAYSSPLGGAIALSFAGSGRVGMRVVGNTIEAWLDQGSGWVLVGSRTDSTYTAAGSIGAELYGGTNRSFDDFGGGTVGP